MNIDIDQFIKDQKSKIADERNYITKISNDNLAKKEMFSSNVSCQNLNNDSFVFKMKEGENMKNKYKQELRNEFSTIKQLDKYMSPSTARMDKVHGDNSDDEGLLYGMKYSNSASKRKEKVRNDEYNKFKAMDEEKFKNRFSDKKNAASLRVAQNESYIKSNPISSDLTTSDSPPLQTRVSRPNNEAAPVEYMPTNGHPKVYDSKIDELERKVEELRNFRIQNPYIIYPTDDNRRNLSEERSDPLRYSTTSLGQSHLRYLEDTEQRLRDIEAKYDRRKIDFVANGRTVSKLRPILDDEGLFTRNGSDPKTVATFRNHEKPPANEARSILPMGRQNDDDARRRQQDEYRRDLQSQMREKAEKSKSMNTESYVSFFDRFGTKEVSRKQPDVASAKVEKDTEYFFYADRNPLDDYGVDIMAPMHRDMGPRSAEAAHSGGNKEANLFFGERDNQSSKEAYRNELKKQIEETKLRKEVERKKLDDYERRKNDEIARYEPFGRGGGGAPLRNDKGETISDLKRIQFDPAMVKRDPPVIKPSSHAPAMAPDSQSPPNSQRGFARGGNGIFGNALSDEEKVKAERYKDELKLQIELNKRQRDIDKENERIREDNERIKFEKDQKLIQIELENERKRQQEKDAEHQRKLEESRIAASNEKERNNNARMAKESREDERYKASVAEPAPRHESARIHSPIIRTETPRRDYHETLQDQLRLEIAASHRAQVNREDSKIMSQLHNLKNQLYNEKLRVEQALIRQKDDVDIYDPRLNVNRPHLDRTMTNGDDHFSPDIFQAIVDNKKPQTVRRDHLKTKATTPRKHRYTEAENDECLKQQSQILDRMKQKDFSRLQLMMPEMGPEHLGGLRPGTQMSNQLESDSAFLPFNQSSDFQLRNIQSQASDVDYHFTKPRSAKLSEFGSNTSLNIDELTRKNEQRLRKIKRLQDENDSNQSSEDLLNKIVADNNYNSDLFH